MPVGSRLARALDSPGAWIRLPCRPHTQQSHGIPLLGSGPSGTSPHSVGQGMAAPPYASAIELAFTCVRSLSSNSKPAVRGL